ncbi:MAG TPA: ABATE domain-containing protein [Gammaproteobacteria bacterium]|nr:ABATE domain-containing protein [Gammaproteobacteria bacterium]
MPNTAWLDAIEIVGGHPAVDFVNTVHARLVPTTHDYLETPGHVVGWFFRQGLVDAEAARRLVRLPAGQGQRLLSEARIFRKTLDDLLQDHLDGNTDSAALARFNHALKRLNGWRELSSAQDDFAWTYRIDPAHPESLLAPLAFGAADLLVSPELERLKMCPLEGCGWLFLDYSRNGSRHWCSMKTCGNVAKLRRYRARQKDE